MIEKKWFIRTKTLEIKGSYTRDEIIVFIDDNTITNDDEICSGNGFWFKISENDLLMNYLFKNIIQEFDPSSKTKTTLSKLDKNSNKRQEDSTIGKVFDYIQNKKLKNTFLNHFKKYKKQLTEKKEDE